MSSWTTSIAGTAALSMMLAYMFLRLRLRGVGSLFGPQSKLSAVALIVLTGIVPTGLGLILALVTHNKGVMLYLGLLLPSVLWLPKAAVERIRKRGSLLPESLAWLRSPTRRLDERIGDDMEAWCEGG